MPNPKQRHSKQRSRTRRAHFKTSIPTIDICPTTGTPHLRHRAYYVDGNLYYNGRLVAEAKVNA
ncbi:MAG TPA: 50S ribosomal protein L32 [Chitinophagales bacterium]|nr:50S ribosomal protein L32 [Chitinophagales bacterium]